MVYQILSQNGLGDYYRLEQQPGISFKKEKTGDLWFLDDPEMLERLIDFRDGSIAKITFRLPQIHCSSCLWLLERLYQLNGGIVNSRVNFLQKRATITFDLEKISLRELVELLASIGYKPDLQLDLADRRSGPSTDRSLYYQLGVAGFIFGNVMLFSFPEYLGLEDSFFDRGFGYLNLLFSLPVVLYCARDYWRSALLGIQQRHLNIDVPITLGILALFIRSTYEILSGAGAGYLDSLSGLVFFLLIGKWFQQFTYDQLNFARDYRSYFPLSVSKKQDGVWRSTPLQKVAVGDILLVRNQELIPVDGRLLSLPAAIDYSFVTGERDPVYKDQGEKVYAGGQLVGQSVEISVLKAPENSYLAQLWKDSAFAKEKTGGSSAFADRVGTYFTWIVLFIATVSCLYWCVFDPGLALNSFTAVLIIACPCAIALAIPFSYGNLMRILGRNGLYLRDVSVIESIQSVRQIIFDKTGTLMHAGDRSIRYEGIELSGEDRCRVRQLCLQSSHPRSRQIAKALPACSEVDVTDFVETTGAGIQAHLGGKFVRLGSAAFLQVTGGDEAPVWLEIDGKIAGKFHFDAELRSGAGTLIRELQTDYQLSLLSGDNRRDEATLKSFFPSSDQMLFRQSPLDKLQFVKDRQKTGQRVMMVGDGLNDAGALQQSDAGIVLCDDINNFTPASDAILDARSFAKLPQYLTLVRSGRSVIWFTYGLAAIYNVIGLSFAVRGALSPIIAAILMPLSSITVVVAGVLATSILGRFYGK